jgi:hypothetical protein
MEILTGKHMNVVLSCTLKVNIEIQYFVLEDQVEFVRISSQHDCKLKCGNPNQVHRLDSSTPLVAVCTHHSEVQVIAQRFYL